MLHHKYSCKAVMALQLCPRLAERYKDQATKDGIFRRSIIAILARHQPTVRLKHDLHLHLYTLPPHSELHSLAARNVLGDEVRKVDALIAPQRYCRILANFHSVHGHKHVIHVQLPNCWAQWPDRWHTHAAREAAGQTERAPKRR